MVLASDYASTASGWVLSVLATVTLIFVAWIAKTLVKQDKVLDRLVRAVFPDDSPSLPRQVETIKDSVDMLRITGSDRLREIVHEAGLTRAEAVRTAIQSQEILREIRKSQIEEPDKNKGQDL